jgi:anti-anti-sigma factor
VADRADKAVGPAVGAGQRAAEHAVGLARPVGVGGQQRVDALAGAQQGREAVLLDGLAEVQPAAAAPGADGGVGGLRHREELYAARRGRRRPAPHTLPAVGEPPGHAAAATGPPPFSADVLDDPACVAVAGELDLGSVGRFEAALARAEDRGDDPVVVDLREVAFMDSSGLRAILEAYKRGLASGRRLRVVCGPGAVRRVLEITGAVTVLDVAEELDG